MERFFVFTLGFHEDFAVRRLTSFAAGRGDGFLCVTLKPVAGATVRAYNNLVSFASVNGVTAFGLLEVDMSEITGREDLIRGDIGRIAELKPGGGGGGREYIVVPSLTGMLMVADNLVADLERRRSSDEMTPIYIMSWKRELSGRLRKLNISDACPHVGAGGYGY